jgi:CheY-like chemotaxis protein
MTKIAVVDDEPDILYVVKKLLVKEGYEVVTYPSGEECLTDVEGVNPDLILSDIMMPGMDGWELAKELKDNPSTKDIPIIMLTVRVSEDSQEKSFAVGHANAHIGKPINKEKMLNTIKWILKMQGR